MHVRGVCYFLGIFRSPFICGPSLLAFAGVRVGPIKQRLKTMCVPSPLSRIHAGSLLSSKMHLNLNLTQMLMLDNINRVLFEICLVRPVKTLLLMFCLKHLAVCLKLIMCKRISLGAHTLCST